MVLKVNFSIPSFIMTEGFTAFWLATELFESLFDLSCQLFIFLLGIGQKLTNRFRDEQVKRRLCFAKRNKP